MTDDAPKRPARWGLIIPIAIFFAAALGWTIYWHALKSDAEAALVRIIASERAAGAEFEANLVRSWGFPRELALELENVAYAPGDGAWRMTTPHLRANINPSNPRHLILEFDQPISFAFPERAPTVLNTDGMRVSVRFTSDGAIADAGIEGANIIHADPVPEGRGFRAARIIANIRPAPHSVHEHQLALDIDGLALERDVRGLEPLGRTIEALSFRIVLTHAEALLAPPRAHPLEAWRAAEGTARLDGVRLKWGLVQLTAQGNVRFDAARRPGGRATLRLDDPGAVFRALADAPSLEPESQRGFAARAADAPAPRDVPLEATAGVLSLDGVRLRTLDPAY